MVNLKNPLVIGMGEVGQAISEYIFEAGFFFKMFDIKKHFKEDFKNTNYDIVHICFPQHDSNFNYHVNEYLKRIKPKICIIHTTTSVGTCEKIQNKNKEILIVHIPIRGSHGRLKEQIKEFPLFIGIGKSSINNHTLATALWIYLRQIFPNTDLNTFKSTKETELAKLASVVWYGMNIAFVQELKLICEKHEIDFDEAYSNYFRSDKVGITYHGSSKGDAFAIAITDRPIFYPGFIGGKCVIQDTKLMKGIGINDKIYNFILQTNEFFDPEHICTDCGKRNIKPWKLRFRPYCFECYKKYVNAKEV